MDRNRRLHSLGGEEHQQSPLGECDLSRHRVARSYADWPKRGSATGAFHNSETPWRSGQRERLHFFAQNKSDSFVPLLLSDHKGTTTVVDWSVRELNEKWLDVGLSGSPAQVSRGSRAIFARTMR